VNTSSIPIHGRGSAINPTGRFEHVRIERDPDAEFEQEDQFSTRTQFFEDSAESILVRNDSPDVGFETSLNVYRGCEHGCSYCFARPFHEYLGFSAGLDFETKIFVKTKAPELLRTKLSKPSWKPQVVMMSGVTDCYQPAEKHFKLTRRCLEVFAEFRNPVSIITKNSLVARDIDLLSGLAKVNAARVFVSVTTLDRDVSRKMEPRASLPLQRLRAIQELAQAGIPVGVMAAPMIPGLTDHELPAILEAARSAGARYASYILLRLPHGVKDVFTDWLSTHEPGKKDRILARIRDLRGGKLYDSEWGKRMTGSGIFAEQLSRIFEVTARRLRFDSEPEPLSTESFIPPGGRQLSLL